MHTLILDAQQPQTILLQDCNNHVIFTLELLNKDKNTMGITVLNISPKNVRVISRSEAKNQIENAIKNIKRGVMKF